MARNDQTDYKAHTHDMQTREGSKTAIWGVAGFAVLLLVIAVLAYWGGYFDGETDLPEPPVAEAEGAGTD